MAEVIADMKEQSPPAAHPDDLEAVNEKKTVQRWSETVSTNYADLIFIICSLTTGLCDGVIYASFGCFISMQTGNTIFLGLGAAGIPDNKPYGWLKSLTSISGFFVGSFVFAKIMRYFGNRKRGTLTISFGVQAVMVLVAAAILQSDAIPHSLHDQPSSGPLFLELIPLAILAFQFGGQIAASRGMGFNELPTVVLTSVYFDIASDPGLTDSVTKNVKRNRRIGSVAAIAIGAIIAGWLCRSDAEMQSALWISGFIKKQHLKMAHIAFPKWAKTITASTGRTYSYVHIQPGKTTQPTLLFLHGFPSSSYDWRHQIEYFSDRDQGREYGILAPDLLGYGGTDKPSSPSEYRAKTMCLELVEIMDREGVERVHGVGHDMGSTVLSRLADYFPQRLASCTFLSVPYTRPGDPFDLQVVNAMTRQFLGFERFGYIEFFVRKESGRVVDEHIDSFFSLFYNSELWKENLAPIGAIENWLKADKRAPLPPFITEEEKATHCKILHGHYNHLVNWYRALVDNINIDDEVQAKLDAKLDMPVLVITEQPGELSIPGSEQMKLVAENITFEQVTTGGHWVQLEARDEVNAMLEKFFN
ncbi:uncharacterized protein TRUGW13939_05195 [Talaromyces rugulosus]|uniref:AB hydrolase-1 domain-containing protein n=1 Tax=Talaromyces rugulosus TaxID=121627 RepID=A0A7H8QVL8_TALRU|nr:uncharacterized protein TRUGW13939_05195 [Talaromyces rugulosus]QKX58074.1 hypothetical protein TRUGW13939_05195 [Talaromyces rugulosus]